MRREAIHFTLERVLKMRIQYAILRGKIYWLQLPVPTDLHERIGKKLIKQSLKTTSPVEAAKKVAGLEEFYRRKFDAIRSGEAVVFPEVEQQAHKLLKTFGLKAGSVTNPEANLDAFYDTLHRKREIYSEGDQLVYNDAPIDEYLSKSEVRAVQLLNESSADPKNTRLSQTLEIYLENHKNPTERLRTYTERVINALINEIGDKKIIEIDRADIHKFRDVILLKNKTTTARRNLSTITAVLTSCYTELEINKQSPAHSVKIKNEGTDSVKRVTFTPAELKTLKREIEANPDDQRQLVGLILDTGMRLSEAVGLSLGDIHLDAKVPYVSVDCEPERDRTLKTENSIREVPLVGMALWAAQRIVAEATKGQRYAFPRYCTDKGLKADSASATGNKWIKKQIGATKTFHCFRHTMNDRLKEVECPEPIIEAICGWKKDGMVAHYGQGYSLAKKQDYLLKVAL